jgi:hypothetical protein
MFVQMGDEMDCFAYRIRSERSSSELAVMSEERLQ